MGAIAEAFVAYAKPLLDQTDGTQEDLQKALSLSQLCYNLALLPDDRRDEAIDEMKSSLPMNDEEFEDFRQSLVLPMLERHREMFPRLHQRGPAYDSPSGPAPWARQMMEPPAAPKPKIDRYAPCPCNSGKKYKFCCGAKGR